jgi:hypothetical protein
MELIKINIAGETVSSQPFFVTVYCETLTLGYLKLTGFEYRIAARGEYK